MLPPETHHGYQFAERARGERSAEHASTPHSARPGRRSVSNAAPCPSAGSVSSSHWISLDGWRAIPAVRMLADGSTAMTRQPRAANHAASRPLPAPDVPVRIPDPPAGDPTPAHGVLQRDDARSRAPGGGPRRRSRRRHREPETLGYPGQAALAAGKGWWVFWSTHRSPAGRPAATCGRASRS